MSIRLACELLRSVEVQMASKLRVIEDLILQEQEQDTSPEVKPQPQHQHEPQDSSDLEEKLELLGSLIEKCVFSLRQDLLTVNKRLDALEAKQAALKDDRPVEAIEAELEQKTASAVLDKNGTGTEIEGKAKTALAKAVQQLPSPPQEEQQEEEEEVVEEEVVEEEEEVVEGVVVEEEEVVVEEEVVEEEVVEEEVVEEEVVEEEVVEEEEEEGLTPFEFKGKTYYHDSEYKVYIPDEDGAVSDPVGIYDPQTKRIRRLT